MSWVRLRYTKEGPARFLSHLDLTRVMERSARRVGIHLALSQGFHPAPRMVFASALALGVSSEAEYVDLELKDEISPDEVRERLNKTLPQGIVITAAGSASGKTALTNLVNRAVYRATLTLPEKEDLSRLEEKVREILGREELLVVREGKQGRKQVNIRPFLEALTMETEPGQAVLAFTLIITPNGSARPEEVVRQLGLEPVRTVIHREGLYCDQNGVRLTPLEIL